MVKFRPKYILIYVLIGFCLLFFWKTFFTISPSKNLIIISIDTLRPDHMGTYGYSKNTTPNIDRWAAKGTVFTNATTIVPMTQPSFAALMTGKSPLKTRVIINHGLPVSSNNKTLAAILSEKGFKTGAFISKGYALQQGFEDMETNAYKKAYYTDKRNIPGTERYSVLSSYKEYENFILNPIDWLKDNKDERFFLWVHLMDPHAPYFPPDDLKCSLDKKYCDSILGKSADELDELRAQYQSCREESAPKDRIGVMETLYDGEIAAADRLIGKILDNLKSSGLDKSTMVVFYGDHGEGFDHNYYFNHRDVLYDSAVKIPFIVINPALSGPPESDILIQNTDMLPTILDLVGINSTDYRFDGKSFAGIFSNFQSLFPQKVRDSSIFINSNWTKFGIADANYKYIYSLPQSCLNNGKREELYDLKADPEEKDNLIEKDRVKANEYKDTLFDYLSDYNLPIELGEDNKLPAPYYDEETEGIKYLGY